MGYCYSMDGRLACDGCGAVGETRKRTCPHRVTYADGTSLPYCPAPALCPRCWEREGKSAVHAGCKERAAARTAQEAGKAFATTGSLF